MEHHWPTAGDGGDRWPSKCLQARLWDDPSDRLPQGLFLGGSTNVEKRVLRVKRAGCSIQK